MKKRLFSIVIAAVICLAVLGGVLNLGTVESQAATPTRQTDVTKASVYMSHTRPNGKSCFTCTYDGEQSWAEDLAWNWDGLMYGIEQWYEEKADWVNQNTSAVTGHYTSMITPSYNYVALGCFRQETGGWYAVAGEFSFKTNMKETQVGVSGLYDQMIEVPQISIKDATVSVKNATYNGKERKPAVTVMLNDATLRKGIDYTVSYSNNINSGKATVTVKGKGQFVGSVKAYFTINKAANPLTIKPVKKTFKRVDLKKTSKATTFKISTTNAKGKVTYKAGKAAANAKIKVSDKGVVSVPRLCKAGTYKIAVKAAGNTNYKAVTKIVTIKVN